MRRGRIYIIIYRIRCSAKVSSLRSQSWAYICREGARCMSARGRLGGGGWSSERDSQVRRFSRASHHSHCLSASAVCVCVWCVTSQKWSSIAFDTTGVSGVTGTESESCAEGDDTGDELVGDTNDDEPKCPDCDKPFSNLDMWAFLSFFSLLLDLVVLEQVIDGV